MITTNAREAYSLAVKQINCMKTEGHSFDFAIFTLGYDFGVTAQTDDNYVRVDAEELLNVIQVVIDHKLHEPKIEQCEDEQHRREISEDNTLALYRIRKMCEQKLVAA